MVTLRLRALGMVEHPDLPEMAENDGEAPPSTGERMVHQTDGSRRPYMLYERKSLQRGHRIDGPAVISEHTATTVLHAGDSATVGARGELHINVAKEALNG